MGNDPTKPFDASKDNGMYIRTDKPFYFSGEEVTGISYYTTVLRKYLLKSWSRQFPKFLCSFEG